ncbi:hypothetical protein SAMN05444412_11167 [Rhodonellum ikkaensis]|uniref:Uncharacterized protein n=1 Tax=Rhodonellum ikkaensis TaxID=336829 RepID=A0A1H3SD66_9BACT|nr:hypothetical protein SAMN05444412_11167 [Rhodonellum ikkaensis]
MLYLSTPIPYILVQLIIPYILVQLIIPYILVQLIIQYVLIIKKKIQGFILVHLLTIGIKNIPYFV